jgi:fructosamine-3-kinase
VRGPELLPVLVHGDAQQNNYLSTDEGAVLVDVSPFCGHPENDLAMIDVFEPVPDDVFAAYRDLCPIDAEFDRRRELWRIPVYLAVIAVDGAKPFGRAFIPRLADALAMFSGG